MREELVTDEQILEYIEWCKRQKLSFRETMSLFEDSHGFEIRKRAEAIWQSHFGSRVEEDPKLSESFENETGLSRADRAREIIAKILIAIGIVAVSIVIVLLIAPVPYYEEFTSSSSWQYGALPGRRVVILLKSNYLPIEPTVFNMRSTFRTIVNRHGKTNAIRVVAYKGLFDDKPYAYGDYINGKLVNFEIY